MKYQGTEHPRHSGSPTEVVRHLLRQRVPTGTPVTTDSAVVTQRVATLERQAPDMVRAARDAGADIEYLGVSPLPAGPMYYNGIGTGWVLAPAGAPEDGVVPREHALRLLRLRDEGIYFPRLYVAHEVAEERAEAIRPQVSAKGQELEPIQTSELVSPIPPPAESVALAEQMVWVSQQIKAGLRRAGSMAVEAVTIPAAAAGAVLSAATLDPIVLGAIPAVSEKPGAPAVWFALARWEW